MKQICITLFVVCVGLHLSAQCIDSSLIDVWYYSPTDEIDSMNLVCGCDSVTYFEDMYALKIKGVSSWKDGPCNDCYNEIIPGFDFFWIDTLTLKGIKPVLGCDNKTYLNDLMALDEGIVSWSEVDTCQCIDSSVIDLSYPVFYPSHFDVKEYRGCDGVFYYSIEEAYYHHGVVSFYQDFGPCEINTEVIDTNYMCPDTIDIVCGCDGKQYQNACVAKYHYGIDNFYQGPCNCTDTAYYDHFTILPCKNSELIYFDPVCACDNTTYLYRCQALYDYEISLFQDGPCQCIDSSFINKDLAYYPQYLPYCGCDGNIYPNQEEAVFKYGVVGSRPCECREDAQIDDDLECYDTDYNPVCGCDSLTYPNECVAKFKAGITKFSKGECGNCYEPQLVYEDYPCSDDYVPVCGCDSITYQNACVARFQKGIMSWTNGPCITSVSDSQIERFSTVYPNPSGGEYIIQAKYREYSIEVFNLSGEKIRFNQIDNNLDISSNSAGVYLLRIEFDNSLVENHRLIML